MELKNYPAILAGIKTKIKEARERAVLAVNAQMLAVYHEIGRVILKQQAEEGWGAKIINRLGKDLRSEFPDLHGFSDRNISYMRAFAEAWPKAIFMQQPVAELQAIDYHSDTIVQQLVAQIPWGHHIVMLDKLQTKKEREFYLIGTVQNKWSRAVLLRQIETGLYHRKGMAITNFNYTLPHGISDLARETLNNPYILEFTGLSEQVQERELEKALVMHMQKFMLELGRGFAFVGKQSNIVVEGDDYFLDLLFFNWQLSCFVIFELKVGEFKPEYAGKLNFYVNTINRQLRQPEHKPTIGVLLCKTPNKTVIEYSLTNIDNPIGVADYEFVKALPKELKSEIPTVEELEAEIEKEYQELQSPSEQKLESLKKRIYDLKVEQIQTDATLPVLTDLFDKGFYPLYEALIKKLQAFNELFMRVGYVWKELPQVETLDDLPDAWKNEDYLKNRPIHTFQYILEGFKSGGPQPVNLVSTVIIHMDTYSYGISIWNFNNNNPFLFKYYHQPLENEDIQLVSTIAFDVVFTDLELTTEAIKNAIAK